MSLTLFMFNGFCLLDIVGLLLFNGLSLFRFLRL